MSEWDRMVDGLGWLIGEVSATREEFWKAQEPGGYSLLDGLESRGYIVRKGDRVAVSDYGLHVHTALSGSDGEA